MNGIKNNKFSKQASLLAKYKHTKRVQTGLLKLAHLCSSINDLSQLYSQLQKIISRYFPADNLYIQQFNDSDFNSVDHYFIDELNCSTVEQKFNPDVIDFIRNIGKPSLINHDHVFILEDDSGYTQRPFTSRNSQTHIVDTWLAAPLTIEHVTIGLIGIRGFVNPNNQVMANLKLIEFIATQIAAAIHRVKADAKLKLYSKDIEEIIFDRTQQLQQSNFQLRQQVEQRRKSELKLYYDAHHDTLTKLPNRAMFSERLEQSIKHLQRHTNHRFGVLFIDLDRFKVINDTLGHHIGDELLIQVSERILQCIRGNDILSRLGGDEFVILLDSISHPDDAEEIANRIIETIKQPFAVEDKQLHTSVSIGITICDQHYKSATEVLRDADAAMYQAKAMGRSRLMFFDQAMREELLANLAIEQDLRQAVSNQEFVLHYQKISNLNNQQTMGYEALLRWQHPSKGLLSPSEFLPMAYETGLIIDIENWVVTQVGKQFDFWQSQQEKQHTFISINLSGQHILQTKMLNRIIKTIKQHIAQPENLILEFNEQAFGQHSDQMIKNLKSLKKTGVKLALDDYGSGLSSLNYINKYPFEIIKLDQSFVRSFSQNNKNMALAKSLSALGQAFGFRLVAEGIESLQQLENVIEIGCEYGQGFYLSKPSAINNSVPNNLDDDNINHCA